MQRFTRFSFRCRIRQVASLMLCLLLCFILTNCAGHKRGTTPVVFYPKPPEPPRLQFLTAISSEEDLKGEKSGLENFLLGPDVTSPEIGRPYDVGSSPGKIYVVDREYNKILIVNLVTNRFEVLQDTRRGVLRAPAGLWVTPDDVKYIADMERKQIVVFDKNNDFIRAYGSGEGEMFDKPVDVTVYENKLYVCDMHRNRILVLDKQTGELLMRIGGIGADEGKLYKPTHITVDDTGNLFVNDAFNFRVQQFDSMGKFVRTIGFHGDRMGAMARTKGVDIDRQGHLYVADAAFERVQIFNENGQLMLFFGGPGTAPGNMYLPAGVHIDYENVEFFKTLADRDFKLKYLLYVCNMSGPNKVNVYGFGDWLGE
ncbi:MAG: 6-bladed beta-propeller [Desulforhopalus sp.]